VNRPDSSTFRAALSPARSGETMQTVKIYTTGTCPYCIQAKQLLKQRGVTELDEIRVDMVPGERQKMMDITGGARCRRSLSAKPTSAAATT
jgi:hypothetical protein